nr:PREDICTED: uncharacterized protein LOC109043833 [Bemisia tabaci]
MYKIFIKPAFIFLILGDHGWDLIKFSKFTWVASSGAPENQKLDPKDTSPGSVVLPERYKDEDAPIPVRVQPGDPPDDVINVSPYYWRGNHSYFLWEHQPCENYKVHLGSQTNNRRIYGCMKVAFNLKKYQEAEVARGQTLSTNCSAIIAGTCFEFGGTKVAAIFSNTPTKIRINTCTSLTAISGTMDQICRAKEEREHSTIAKFPRIKHVFLKKVMHIHP